MKKIFSIIMICLFCASVFAASKGTKMWISVSSAPVKSSTGVFAKTVGKLEYGTEVTQTETKGSRAYITAGKVSGWVATSSLSKRKIVPKGSNFSADADEIALAGKGFNEDVENFYKESGKANYTSVDELEKIEVSEDELYKFIVNGGLLGAE